MPGSKRAKQSLVSRQLNSTIPTLSASSSSPQPVTGSQFTIRQFIRQTAQLAFIAPPDVFRDETANTSTPIHTLAKSTTHAPPRTESPAKSGPSNESNLQYNPYAGIGGSAVIPIPATVGSVAYEGLKIALQGLYNCSDMFLPLKTVAGGLMAIVKIVDVSGSVFG